MPLLAPDCCPREHSGRGGGRLWPAGLALTVSVPPRYIRGGPRSPGCVCLVAAAANPAARLRASEVGMLGEGEGLELLGVFFTVMFGLGVMVVLGKWWEA